MMKRPYSTAALSCCVLCLVIAFAAPVSAGALTVLLQDENGTWLTCWPGNRLQVYNGANCTGSLKYNKTYFGPGNNPINLDDGTYWVKTTCGGASRCDGPVTVPGSITVPCSEVRVLAYANDDPDSRISNYSAVNLNVYAKGSGSASVSKSYFNPDTYSFVLLDSMPHGSYDVRLSYSNSSYRLGGFVANGDNTPAKPLEWDFPVALVQVNTSGCATPMQSVLSLSVDDGGTWNQVDRAGSGWNSNHTFTVFPGQSYRAYVKDKNGNEASSVFDVFETTSGISPAPAAVVVNLSCGS